MTIAEYLMNKMEFLSEKGFLEYMYKYRIYITRISSEEKLSDIHDLADWFLENDEECDGDESKAWERFIKLDLNTLDD